MSPRKPPSNQNSRFRTALFEWLERVILEWTPRGPFRRRLLAWVDRQCRAIVGDGHH